MFESIITNVRVILTSVVTIFTALAVAATEIGLATDVPVVEHWAGRAATFLVAAVAIIRRVTPVPASERGLT